MFFEHIIYPTGVSVKKKISTLPLYDAFATRLLAEIDNVTVKVQKTQISFSNRNNFAFVSFLPARKAKERPLSFQPTSVDPDI